MRPAVLRASCAPGRGGVVSVPLRCARCTSGRSAGPSKTPESWSSYIQYGSPAPLVLDLTLNQISCRDADTTRAQQPKPWSVPVPGRQHSPGLVGGARRHPTLLATLIPFDTTSRTLSLPSPHCP